MREGPGGVGGTGEAAGWGVVDVPGAMLADEVAVCAEPAGAATMGTADVAAVVSVTVVFVIAGAVMRVDVGAAGVGAWPGYDDVEAGGAMAGSAAAIDAVVPPGAVAARPPGTATVGADGLVTVGTPAAMTIGAVGAVPAGAVGAMLAGPTGAEMV